MTRNQTRRKPGPAPAVPARGDPPFRRWRTGLKLSQSEAAEALGFSIGWIKRLDAGEPISRTTALAMLGYETERKPPPKPTILAALNAQPDTMIVSDGTLTPLAHEVAALEGWGLFWGDVSNEIQKLDSSSTFASDDDALAHVRRVAASGSRLHRLALELHHHQEAHE